MQFLEVLAQAFCIVGAAVAKASKELGTRPSGVDVVEQGFKASSGELVFAGQKHPDLWFVAWICCCCGHGV